MTVLGDITLMSRRLELHWTFSTRTFLEKSLLHSLGPISLFTKKRKSLSVLIWGKLLKEQTVPNHYRAGLHQTPKLQQITESDYLALRRVLPPIKPTCGQIVCHHNSLSHLWKLHLIRLHNYSHFLSPMASQIKEGAKLTLPNQLAEWAAQANDMTCLWLLRRWRKPQGLRRPSLADEMI